MSDDVATLRRERDLLGEILAAMHDGVLLVGADGAIALVNPALREMLDLPTAVVGRRPRDVLRHDELGAVLAAARGGQARVAEIDVSGLHPRRFNVRAGALAGEPGAVLAVFVDVTEIRRLETLRRDFVANVSHELRTPVTAIRSAAETLEGGAAAEPAAMARFLEIIVRNATRLNALVEDLLDLSRIESRQMRLKLEVIDVAVVLAHIAELFRERAEARRMSLAVGGAGRARADRRAAEQVLTNLVDNAIKYCPEGSHITLGAVVSGESLRVSVADDGPGIAASHLPRLFERFYRVDAGRSRAVGGTGLGLAIVRHLVEAMGGEVGVDSEVGRGSTFTFTLPREA